MCVQAFRNRMNSKIRKIFSVLFNGEQTWSSIDNYGVMRGSVNVIGGDGLMHDDRPDWRYELKPHWDLNPWQYVHELKRGHAPWYQGIIAVDDCPESVGGFCCVPGSTRFLERWTKFNVAPDKHLGSHRPLST